MFNLSRYKQDIHFLRTLTKLKKKLSNTRQKANMNTFYKTETVQIFFSILPLNEKLMLKD